jgi:hypothetical protein
VTYFSSDLQEFIVSVLDTEKPNMKSGPIMTSSIAHFSVCLGRWKNAALLRTSAVQSQTKECSDETGNKEIALNSRGTKFESHSEQMLSSF